MPIAPLRKHLRLSPDLYRQGHFFVTAVTRLREPLFCGTGEHSVNAAFSSLASLFPAWQIDTPIVMPNHVHFILISGRDDGCTDLGRVVGSFKSLVYREFRNDTGRPEPIWQRNYYERIIRNPVELERVREYILANPDKLEFDWDKILT